MKQPETDVITCATASLARQGYWPAVAAEAFAEGRYSKVIELWLAHKGAQPPASARLVYARALFHTGDHNRARDEFECLLRRNSHNLQAMKYLADIASSEGATLVAGSLYQRILELDPDTSGLVSPLKNHEPREARSVLVHKSSSPMRRTLPLPIAHRPPLVSETLGDLYLEQGHATVALALFRALLVKNDSPELRRKIELTEAKVREKEITHVPTTTL